MDRNMVFVSYSHDDAEWKHQISVQLKVLEQQKLLKLWCDRDIRPGQDWHDEIDRSLQSAKVAVLVVSASFLGSEFIQTEEVPKLLDQHHRDGMHLIPVLVSDCAWQAVPWLASKQMLPRDAEPLLALSEADRNRELANIAREIMELLS